MYDVDLSDASFGLAWKVLRCRHLPGRQRIGVEFVLLKHLE